MPHIEVPVASPGSFPISVVSHSKHPIEDGHVIHHVYVRCNNLPDLILDANPREPTLNRIVTDMSKTLTERPIDFVKFNNGITIICRSVEPQNGGVVLKLEEGMGICNGGHTYLAIKTSMTLDPSALIHLELLELPSEFDIATDNSKLVEIAEARNRNAQLKDISQADQLGYYDKLRSYMKESKMVTWHEGDSDAIQMPPGVDAVYLIRLLKALDPLRFKSVYAPSKPAHAEASRGGKKVHSEWMQDMASYRDKFPAEGQEDEDEE